ncbi:MAG: hypothetical protein ACOX88_06145 [Christensenellales bacterium]|jgi:hypothetical protein
MSREKCRRLSLFLTFILLVSVLLGCADKAPVTTSPENPSPSSEPVIASPPAPTPEPEPQPLDFTWQPYVYSDIYNRAFGEEMQLYCHAMIDAMMIGAESVAYPDEATIYDFEMVIRALFPPYHLLVSGISYSDGTIHLDYALDDAQRKQLLDKFGEQITMLIQSAVMQGDSPAMAAVALYHAYAGMTVYDHEAAADDDVITDVSSYQALTELSGICQSFAAAYAYLCLQCGIDAVNAGGMTESYDEAHDWTLLTLDGNTIIAIPPLKMASALWACAISA